MKKGIRSMLFRFTFVLMLTVILSSSCAEEITPDFLMTGETDTPVSIMISSPEYKSISRFGDERKDSLNRLLKHLSLAVNTDGNTSETIVMIDQEPVYSYVETTTDSIQKTVYSVSPDTVVVQQRENHEDDSSVISFMNDHFFMLNKLLDDLYPAFEKTAEVFSEFAKESSASLNFSGYGKAVKRIVISLPDQYVSDHFPAVPASLAASRESKDFIDRLIFKGPQKIILLYDQENRLLRVNYDGKAGFSEETMRKVSVVWRCKRSDAGKKDHLTLKTPSLTGYDKYNLIYERDVDACSQDFGSIKWDFQLDFREGQTKKKTGFKADLTFAENTLKGEVSYSEKQDGNESKITIVPSIKKEKPSEFSGTIEIANYSGKIVLTRTEYTLQVSPGEKLTVPEILSVQGNESSEEGIVTDDGQIQELLSGVLIRKLLSLPAEDLVFFNSDIPDEVWKTLVQSLF